MSRTAPLFCGNTGWEQVVSIKSDSAFRGHLAVTLSEDSLLKMDGDYRGTRIACVKGTVCVTLQNDHKDHILSDDESFLINRKGRVITWALSVATIDIVFPDTDRYCLIERLRRLVVFGG